jgi:GLPGLI family protein
MNDLTRLFEVKSLTIENMRRKFSILIVIISFSFTITFAQKKFSEGSIIYNVTVNTNDPNPKLADGFDGATNTIYIKGKLSRSELVSVFGTQSTIIDGRTGNVNVLKEYGDKKYLITMTPADWAEANQKYDSVTFSYENEYKTIAGYNCRKAIGKLKSGETFTVYYTPELVPESQIFQYSNKSLPGLVLEYESDLGKNKVVFSATKISFDPVPVVKFDLPKSGFRVMTYKESKGAGK